VGQESNRQPAVYKFSALSSLTFANVHEPAQIRSFEQGTVL
jgi:hypothetical protein